MLGALGRLDLALLSVHVIIVIVIVKAAAAALVIVLQLQAKLVSQGVAAPCSPKELLLVPRVCIIGLVPLHCKHAVFRLFRWNAETRGFYIFWEKLKSRQPQSPAAHLSVCFTLHTQAHALQALLLGRATAYRILQVLMPLS